MKTNQTIGILSLSIGLFSFLITTNDQLDCNILISLLLEEKSLKIASKLGFLAPGLDKWTKVVQAWIFSETWMSNGPVIIPFPRRCMFNKIHVDDSTSNGRVALSSPEIYHIWGTWGKWGLLCKMRTNWGPSPQLRTFLKPLPDRWWLLLILMMFHYKIYFNIKKVL